jgi:hypothetical protein
MPYIGWRFAMTDTINALTALVEVQAEALAVAHRQIREMEAEIMALEVILEDLVDNLAS